jgi:hypothetical protein
MFNWSLKASPQRLDAAAARPRRDSVSGGCWSSLAVALQPADVVFRR